jgi:hypothetical protein
MVVAPIGLAFEGYDLIGSGRRLWSLLAKVGAVGNA